MPFRTSTRPTAVPLGASQVDPTLQTSAINLGAPTPGISFDGVGVGFFGFTPNAAPPDPNGTVGPNHYFETVNESFAIFNKSGSLIVGPLNINTIWSGFGGGCQTNNDGDPTVVYDKIADRWIVQQFSVSTTPYLQCVAVSASNDPTGAYNRYSFVFTDFPDYPKLGVWPDAYYLTINAFAGGTTFNGARVCALNRAAMIAGTTASLVCFNTTTSFGSLLPADLDGATLPPAGAPNYLVALNTSTTLGVWKFHVDFTTPANSTFVGPTNVTIASFTEACASTGTCIPQAGTTQKLDSLGDRAMYRLAYRNFGSYAAMVVNHSILAGTVPSGVRWYELRINSGTPSLFQQGTYSPDASSRWMGSIAMDKNGNMALGYSVSSSSMSPGIHYTGRLAGDAAGTMTQGENVIINGGGSQSGSGLSRWGDYTSMSVDPSDDCTFWYTDEYLKTTGAFNWSTRVGTFKMPGCGAADFSISAPASKTIGLGDFATYLVTETPLNGFSGAITLSVTGLPAGATSGFTTNPFTGTSAMYIVTHAGTPLGTFPLTITGTSGALTHSINVTLVITAHGPVDFALSASPTNQTVTQGNSAVYTVTETPAGGFAGSVTLIAVNVPTGATATFGTNPFTGSTTMTISTTGSTPLGTYQIAIGAYSGSLLHTTPVNLKVQ